MFNIKYQVGLIGYPVKHSWSPILFQRVAEIENLPLRYHAWQLAPAHLEEFIGWLRKSSVLGINVTLPFKERIFSCLDEIDPTARLIGAVNVVKKVEHKLYGYNSDWYGFLMSVKKIGHQPKKVVILGGGGAARAVIFAATFLGCQKVIVVGRSQSKLIKLHDDFSTLVNLRIMEWGDDVVEDEIAEADLVVNATPLGLPGVSGLFPLKPTAPSQTFSEGQKLFFDLVYKPEITPFMKIGHERGAKATNGLNMLLFQAMMSLEIWTGLKTSEQSWFQAYQEASERSFKQPTEREE